MRVVICDPDHLYVNSVVASIKRWQAMHSCSKLSIFAYTSSEDLLEYADRMQPFDLAFLDIQFPSELSGLVLAQKLRMQNDQITTVFITNHEEYAIDGYKVSAWRFMKKPLTDASIFECLNFARRQLESLQGSSLLVSNSRLIYKISYISILYIESRAHYIYIHTLEKDRTVTVREQLPILHASLPEDIFIRCHRSYVVNLHHIRCMTKRSVILFDGNDVPVSNTYWESACNSFKKFLSKLV